MTDFRVAKEDSKEDQFTAGIERVTSKAPSALYLCLALGSMVPENGEARSGESKRTETTLVVQK